MVVEYPSCGHNTLQPLIKFANGSDTRLTVFDWRRECRQLEAAYSSHQRLLAGLRAPHAEPILTLNYIEDNMALARLGESPKAKIYRSARIYAANSVWWFDTREGVQFGPFICRIAAICALAVYVAQHLHENQNSRSQESDPPGAQDGIAHMVEEVLDVLRQHRDYGAKAATNWAKSRLEELRESRTPTSDTVGRIRVLEFSLRHPEQTFNFEHFLECRAG